ncbi:MAG: hypothetical protein OXI16_13760 [Chloroflexota bacterium]|nr:hypothetical protein [Chloroflexota bacterium]
MVSYIASEQDISRLGYLVLTAIQHLNSRQVAADAQTVSTVLMLVPHLTGLDLECPGVEATEAVLDAANRLEESGRLTETEGLTATPKDEGDFTVLVLPTDLQEHSHAIEFASSIYAQGTDEQATALTLMVHLHHIAVQEGWPDEGRMSLLLNILAPEMDEDTVRVIRRGVTIAAQSRLDWPKIRAKL